MPRVTLIGFRATGKTSVAVRLAELLGCEWADSDAVFESAVGRSVADFFATEGEPAFRERETEILDGLLGRCGGVLATGGGVVVREANRAMLAARGRPVVWLDAGVEQVRSRLAADPSTALRRPSLTGGDPSAEAARLLEERGPLYASLADLRVDTSTLDADGVAGRIADWIAVREGRPVRGPAVDGAR